MKLYLIRHAIAEPRQSGRPDATRALTPEGRERFARSVKGMKKLGITFDVLWYSPLIRAAETATFLEPLLKPKKARAQETPLLAKSPTRALLDLLEGEEVGLVGHQPWLGELLGWLCFGDPARGEHVPLKKGAVALLEGPLSPGEMSLRMLLPSRALRRFC